MAARKLSNTQLVVITGITAMVLLGLACVAYVITTRNGPSLPDIAAADPPSATQPPQPPAAFPLTLSKETTVITSPLLPDGTPDYITALNQLHSQGVTPENNALIPLLQIRGTDILPPDIRFKFLELAGADATPPDTRVFQTLSDYLKNGINPGIRDNAAEQISEASQKPWSAAQYPVVAGYIESQTRFLDLAVEASKRPYFYDPFVSPDDRMSSWVPFSYAGMANIGRVWCARAMLRVSTGDLDGALADAVGIKRFARLLATERTLLPILLGIVYDTIANEALGNVIASGILSEDQCAAYAKALDLPPLPSISAAETQLRYSALASLFIPLANGTFDPPKFSSNPTLFTLISSIDPSAVDWNLVLKHFNAAHDQALNMLRAPSREEVTRQDNLLNETVLAWRAELQANGGNLQPIANESKPAYSERVAHGLLSNSYNLNTFAPYEIKRRDADLRSTMLQLLLAAAKSKAHTGTWPPSLDQLVPTYLKQLPPDPNSPDASPLVYRLTPNGPHISSLGPDHTSNTPDDILIGAH